MVCNDESSIPCAHNTLKAYRACAHLELMMRCVCSATDRLLVKVKPRILITVTRLIFGSGGGGCIYIYSFLLRLLSAKTISAYCLDDDDDVMARIRDIHSLKYDHQRLK